MLGGEVRYADSNGVAIAYAEYGEGRIDVVMFPGLFSHLELNAEIPFYRPFLERIPRFARLIVFDRRGSGLSDRSRFGTAEERMDDLRAVMDAVGLERAAVIGTADGGQLAALFAAAHPERVTSLVLHETAAQRTLESGNAPTDDALDALAGAWGSGAFMGLLFDGCLPNADNQATAARWERNIAWPQQFRDLFAQLLRTDASDALPLIAAPTLVVHNAGDNILPVAGAREAARAIPHARLVELPYDVHCDWAGNSIHAAIDVIEPFLAGQITPPVRTQRQLATVLFTDIVDSTGETRRRGDERWQRLLDELDAVTARAAADQSGRVVKSTGDGALCVFDGPGRAVTAALAVTRAAAARGIALRSGVHCGEVELRDNDLGGIAVHLAARIQEAAAPGEIVVSRTIVDLTFGSDLRFSERGAVTLRGFDQPWELFAVSA